MGAGKLHLNVLLGVSHTSIMVDGTTHRPPNGCNIRMFNAGAGCPCTKKRFNAGPPPGGCTKLSFKGGHCTLLEGAPSYDRVVPTLK